MPTDVKIKGELDMLRVKEPIQPTMLNMSSASKAGLSFFGLTAMDGEDVWIQIGEVSYMKNVPGSSPTGADD